MTDIVEELRHCLANDTAPDAFLVQEVIKEIERLRTTLGLIVGLDEADRIARNEHATTARAADDGRDEEDRPGTTD